MGRMKDLFIDLRNQEPDDTDWNAPTFDSAGYTEADREPDPPVVDPGEDPADVPPIKIDTTTGKKLWLIKSIRDDAEYKIWAFNYKQALELLPMIESF
jgi:hypothetical protein